MVGEGGGLLSKRITAGVGNIIGSCGMNAGMERAVR